MKTIDTFRLDGQVALVTGGARTLGWDMADAVEGRRPPFRSADEGVET